LAASDSKRSLQDRQQLPPIKLGKITKYESPANAKLIKKKRPSMRFSSLENKAVIKIERQTTDEAIIMISSNNGLP